MVLPPPMSMFEEPTILKYTILMLSIRNVVAHPFVLKVLRYPDTHASSSAASSFVAIMFSVPVCFACHSLLWMEGSLGDIAAGTSDYTDGWNWLTMVTMKYTSAYMLQDLLMMLLDEYRYVSDEPYFVSFVLHHTGCLIYLSMVRYYSAGSFSVLILILMGEITNPMQNTINVCLQGIKAGKKWPRKVLSVVNPIFGLGEFVGGFLFFFASSSTFHDPDPPPPPPSLRRLCRSSPYDCPPLCRALLGPVDS
jgi:hypothetical protein